MSRNPKITAFVATAFFFAGASSLSAGFSRGMPKATNENPLDTPYAELAETFGSPYGKVQTGCYWYWLCGNISSDGAAKDIEAMKRAGIDRAYIADIGKIDTLKRGPVDTFSPEWRDAFQTAFRRASELGVEIGLFNCPGWSMAGGPWVKPEQSMRRIVSRSLVVEGPKNGVALPPFGSVQHVRDLFAVAYLMPDGFGGRIERKGVSIDDAKPKSVELESESAFRAQSAELLLASGEIAGTLVVEADDRGTWRRLCETPFSRTFHAIGTGFAPFAPITFSFPATTARKFRLTVVPDKKRKATFSRVAVLGEPLVAMAAEKSLAKMHETSLPMWKEYKWPVEAECAKGTALDPAKAVVLHDKVAPNGDLHWNVPEGKWIIYRFGEAPTGAKNNPVNPGASGYETDKMSRRHIASHFDAFIGKMLDETPVQHRKAIGYAVMDSYEVGGQNFTDGFAEKFRASFGYDPSPYLPAVYGMSVSSRADSDRFLWDLRRFVADEVAYSFVGGLRTAANARGMETWLENYGHWGFPGEFLQYGGQSDEVSGEFWCEGDLGSIENRAASSCAHTYGKRLVWAESNTCVFRPLQRGPMDLKQRTDRFFAEGINATILHFYAHQPDDRKPGVFEGFGNEFHRNNTWFEHLDVFTGYLKRCGWMLRQGLNVADVAYFIGEDAPCMTGVCDPALPPGRQFDYINAEVLEETADVDEKGRIVLPHGTAYEVLVLPKLETMRPGMAECIERLVNAGAFVLGPKPKRSPSLAGQPQSDEKVKEIADRLWGGVDGDKIKFARRGKGMIAWNMALEDALKMRGSEPDAVFDAKSKLAYAHRTMPNAEIYFVSNQSGSEIPLVDVSFRDGKSRAPELWDAATGARRAAKWRKDGARTAVTLSLAKHESVFVVFPAESQCGGAKAQSDSRCASGATREMNIAGPWTVLFESDALHRGPKEPVVLDNLIDLSTSSDPAVKFYSGRITYKTKFSLPRTASSIPSPSPITLSIGNVAVTAKVEVNGKYAGGVCFAPYRLDIAPFAREGENELEIEVCNLWVNRLAGDEGLENRPTWASCRYWGQPPPLPKSGLLGPVCIQMRD